MSKVRLRPGKLEIYLLRNQKPLVPLNVCGRAT